LLPLLWIGRAIALLGGKSMGNRLARFAITRWAKLCCAVLGVRIERSGPIPEPPFFLVANHLSYLDILVLHATVRGNFLSKSEIGSWPIAGWLAKWAGTLFIDRSNRKDVSRAIPEMQAVLHSGEGVILFPEGTSTAGKQVENFHPSLMQTPIDIGMHTHVASLAYTTHAPSPPAYWSVCWWGDMPFASHLLKLLTLKRIDAAVRFHERTFQGADRKELANRARAGVIEIFEPSAPASLDTGTGGLPGVS
ncbi:MAG: 1-acyl-sn-glycerol-3-phosphate acyltransferase, partial [Planctomycetes bacterium]|nr:1-acyl-sn-glycerol-3-phosphate acyltransferase [Planctomycetota bacterium]